VLHALQTETWHPPQLHTLPCVVGLPKSWYASSVFQGLIDGVFDPELPDHVEHTDKIPYPEWDFNEYSVKSSMYFNCLEKFTNTNIEEWRIPSTFYWEHEEVCLLFCFININFF